MFIADYKGHNILRYNMTSEELSVFAHNSDMNQPNDLGRFTHIIFLFEGQLRPLRTRTVHPSICPCEPRMETDGKFCHGRIRMTDCDVV